MKTIKQIKDIILIIAAVILFCVGVVFLFGEPVEGGFFDNLLGIFVMKVTAVVDFVLIAVAYKYLSDDTKAKIQDFINRYFGH